MEDKNRSKEEAAELLKKEMGEEEYKKLMDGVDAVIDFTEKFGAPYDKINEKIKDSFEKGLVAEKNGLIIGLEEKDEK